MACTAAYFTEGNPIEGKNFIVKFKSIKPMGANAEKNRMQLFDTENNPINNVVVTSAVWSKKPANEGDSLKILTAKQLSLKNGRPAYLLRDWDIVKPKASVSSAPKPKAQAPLGLG